MKKIIYLLIFFVLLFFYWDIGSQIENRSDAEDIYEYALMIEQGEDHPWFYHNHHICFGILIQSLFKVIQYFNFSPSVIDFMRALSALASAGTLLIFFKFCYNRFKLRFLGSLIATTSFGTMYGFFRYAAEAEIIALSLFFMISSFYLLTDESKSRLTFIFGVLFSCAAILIHIMNVVGVFVAIPTFMIFHRFYKKIFFHILFSFLIVILTYLFIYHYHSILDPSLKKIISFNSGVTIFGEFLKGCIAFIQCLISFDFVLGFSSVRAFLAELFASRMLVEEFYFGEQLSRNYIIFSFITFIIIIFLSFFIFIKSLFFWKNYLKSKINFLDSNIRSLFISSLLFFLCYSLILLIVEPGNPELWVMSLLPFSLFISIFIILPMMNINKLWLPFLLTIFLIVHNSNALKKLRDIDKDYNFQKTHIISNIIPNDAIIITAGSPVFERYLSHHIDNKVLYLYDFSEDEMFKLPAKYFNNKVYLLDNIFKQNKSLCNRFPIKTQQINRFAEYIYPNVIKESSSSIITIYKMK